MELKLAEARLKRGPGPPGRGFRAIELKFTNAAASNFPHKRLESQALMGEFPFGRGRKGIGLHYTSRAMTAPISP